MKQFIFLSLLALFVGLLGHGAAAKPPNILLILADDLGYSDLGCYGGEIETPNLDGLAAGGLRFTQFYNTARCWPTRASLLAGYYAQQVRRDALPGVKRGTRPAWAKLLPEYLQPHGYRSYHSGKWHIDGKPMSSGFDRSYEISNHGFFRLPKYSLNGELRPGRELGEDWYATTAKADYAIEFLKEHAKDHADKPFFQFLAFTAPHFPLHALPEDIDLFRERYQAGWNSIQKARWEKQKELGIASGSHPLPEPEEDLGPPYHFPKAYRILGDGEVGRPVPWDSLTDKQKAFQAEKMAIHAAMIYRMDLEIGRVLEQVKEMGEWDNTLILFLSDNGASAEIMVRGDGHDPEQPMGSAFTYLCLGPGWSTACNTPFRRHKTWVHEGGCATPLIVHWPKGISEKGKLRHTPGHIIDFVPTVFDIVSGKEVVKNSGPVTPGDSLFSTFKKDLCNEKKEIWFSHEGNRALRKGDWKLVASKKEPWELYNLKEDRNETRNLAAKFPDKVNKMAQLWKSMEKQFVRDATGK